MGAGSSGVSTPQRYQAHGSVAQEAPGGEG